MSDADGQGQARRRPAAWLALLLIVATVITVPPAARAAPAGTAAQMLAERYAPIVVLRRYDQPCGSAGEPFVPMTVDAVLGNAEVALRQICNGDPVIKWRRPLGTCMAEARACIWTLPGTAADTAS
jgi:hypothetical protein